MAGLIRYCGDTISPLPPSEVMGKSFFCPMAGAHFQFRWHEATQENSISPTIVVISFVLLGVQGHICKVPCREHEKLLKP